MQTGLVRQSRSSWGAATGSTYNVLCSDGKIRRATVTGEADTAFTLPARVKVNGRTVTGHIYVNTLDYPDPVYTFSAFTYRKNWDALPSWPANGTVPLPCEHCHGAMYRHSRTCQIVREFVSLGPITRAVYG